MEETNKNKEQKDDAITAAYALGRYDGWKEVEARVHELEGSLSSSISKQSKMADGIERVVKANHALAAKAQGAEARAEQTEARAEKAEANVVRLTKMVDWLAEFVFDRPCAYACCPFDKHRPTGPDDDDDCDKTHIQCWAEAARKAVAAGEG